MGLLLLLSGLPLGLVAPAQSASGVTTYFLHAPTPAEPAHQLTDDFFALSAPTMNATTPTRLTAGVAQTNGVGDPDFRSSPLLAYWVGAAHGDVTNLTADVWVDARQPVTLTFSVFGDGVSGAASPFARAVANVPGSLTVGAQRVHVDFGHESSEVEAQMVFSLNVEETQAPVAILFDSVNFPSSLTFSLGDAIVAPPVDREPAIGWSNVTTVNATAAGVETSLAISPVDARTMLACSPSGAPNTADGQSFFHISRDDGATWRFLSVETSVTDTRSFAFEGGDCDVAFDAAGTMYSADTWLGDLSVGHSFDNGTTWDGTAFAAGVPIVDRPWLVGGPAGTIHLTWQDVQQEMPSTIWYSRSTDSGATFTTPTLVASAGMNGGFTWTGNFVVSPNGNDIYSVYTRRQGPALNGQDGSGPESVWVAASHDAGGTFTSHLVAAMPNPASFLYPSIAMDAGGKLHVVFSSRTPTDRPIWYATSANGANNWSAPIKVLSGVAAWSPWVVGGADGQAAIAWYGTKEALGNTTAPFDWYLFAARVANGTVVSAGPTTTTPIFSGVQSATPEFDQLRLLPDGKIAIGASAFVLDQSATSWAMFFQRER